MSLLHNHQVFLNLRVPLFYVLIHSSQLPQVGTCVTTSFTEWNLHPEKSAMVPTVKKVVAFTTLFVIDPAEIEISDARRVRGSFNRVFYAAFAIHIYLALTFP